MVAERVERRRRGHVGGHDARDDALTPLGVVAADDDDVGDAGVGGEHPLDSFRPDLLATGDDDVGAPPVHDEPDVGDDLAAVAGGEPAVGVLRVGPVAVARSSIGPRTCDLAVVTTRTSTPSSGKPS